MGFWRNLKQYSYMSWETGDKLRERNWHPGSLTIAVSIQELPVEEKFLVCDAVCLLDIKEDSKAFMCM
jgi:hypothetical protein